MKFQVINPATTLLKRLFAQAIGYGADDVEELDDKDPDDLEDFFAQLADEPADHSSDTSEEEEEEEEPEAVAGDEAKVDEPEVEDKPVKEEPSKDVPEATAVEEQPKVEPVVEEVVVPEVSPEEQQKQYEQVMGELQKAYAISDEDADAILTDPKTAIPKLMANAHVKMMQTFHNMVQHMVPTLIDTHQTQSTSRQTLVQKFSAAWPDLVGKEHEQVVVAAIQTVRQLNPNIDTDTLIKKVGPVAYSIMGKQAPAEQPPKAPVAKPKPKPHVPVRSRETSPAKSVTSGDPVADFIGSLLEKKE